MRNKIAILLATYNGGEYIDEQIRSILNQTYSNWELFIRDDGSIDNTMEIVKHYCSKDNRIHIVDNEFTHKGACQNFGNLLKITWDEDWKFLMFADQDDFWHEDKVQITLNSMLCELYSERKPKLVYTDFEYADDCLNALKSETDKNISNWRKPNIERLLAENNIYGCTMMINRALAEIVYPIPLCAENHDYWISLVAALFGDIVHVKKRTMLYRQHLNNVSGHYLNSSFKARLKRYYKKNERLESILTGRFEMANMLLKYFDRKLSAENLNLLVGFANLKKMSPYRRVLFCWKHGIKKNSFIQSFAFYFLLFRL
jgi:glycosyltransferase involved in cell wall biosynthesis